MYPSRVLASVHAICGGRISAHQANRALSSLSHVDPTTGRPQMVDVSSKQVTVREATAKGSVLLSRALMAALGSSQLSSGEVMSKKGPVLATAVIAGTQAVKQTSNLIPFCHNVNIESCKFDIQLQPISPADSNSVGREGYSHSVEIACTVKCEGKTGVEMEALVGVSNAALCVYDMLKGLSHDMVISSIQLQQKRGGKSDYDGSRL